jgi:hypothetical protein
MKRIAVPLAVIAASTVIALLVFELLLRAIGYSAPVWREPHPQLGWSLRPGVEGWNTGENRAYVKINEAGWRDRPHALEKPAGVYRVAVLGDSYSEAMHVALEDTYWSRLEGLLKSCTGKNVEVLNFSAAGYGTAQQYVALQSVALRYKPDLVLLQFTNGNDVRNNSRALEPEKERPFFTLQGDELRLDAAFASDPQFLARQTTGSEVVRRLTDYSRTLQMVRTVSQAGLVSRAHATRSDEIEAGLDLAPLAPPATPQWQEAWRVTERLIDELNGLAKKNGAPLALMMVPYAIQVHPDPAVRESVRQKLGVEDLFYPERRLEAFGKARGIPVVALAPEMQKVSQAEKRYLHGFDKSRPGLGHWNEQGHRVAAEITAQRLCNGLAKPRLSPPG